MKLYISAGAAVRRLRGPTELDDRLNLILGNASEGKEKITASSQAVFNFLRRC
jgi:hypothetical protein